MQSMHIPRLVMHRQAPLYCSRPTMWDKSSITMHSLKRRLQTEQLHRMQRIRLEDEASRSTPAFRSGEEMDLRPIPYNERGAPEQV